MAGADADKANASAMVWASLVREAQAASENAKQGSFGTTDLAKVPLDDPGHWPVLVAPRATRLSDGSGTPDALENLYMSANSDEDGISLCTTPPCVFESCMEGDLHDKREWICLSNKRYAEAVKDVDADADVAEFTASAAVAASTAALDSALDPSPAVDTPLAATLGPGLADASDAADWLIVDMCAEAGIESCSSGASDTSTLLEEEVDDIDVVEPAPVFQAVTTSDDRDDATSTGTHSASESLLAL
ncbi:Hypothetical Protein FCC1311_110622 [Hondaea fermentalgiana]|uniref:Uncharacterized protein n=1 Tax=Hondaea fermentalgiana TaxID=2315210 RepID=A0A2R5GVG5_9STRA|nr:Hypothetical Protein FCC1311_110622 [Hondaea fermentalgiana]|eukprot:GBG34840.1 Hypothetical Protein FCC1311_110622 [Hondaea fermentalgiana]